MSATLAPLPYKIDPSIIHLAKTAAKAEAFDQMCMLLQEIEDLEKNVLRQRGSRSKKAFERALEMQGRLQEARDLLALMRQRWRT